MLIRNKTIWTPDNSFLLEYRARIESGEIIVGQELWQELENLKEEYELEDIMLFDLFPNTYHVESIVLLKHCKPL